MRFPRIIFFTLALVLLVVAASASFVWAAQEDERSTVNPNLPLGGTGEAPTGIGGTIFGVYRFALLVAGLLAFGAIVYGAIKYAASGGNSSMQSDAREWITQAIWGVVLLLGATYLLGVINPDLTKLRESPPAAAIESDDSSLEDLLSSASGTLYGCRDNKNKTLCSFSATCAGNTCSSGCEPVSRDSCGTVGRCPSGQTSPYHKLVNNECVRVDACGVTSQVTKRRCNL